MAVAQVFVGKAALFRPEKQGDAARRQMFAQEARASFEPPKRVVQIPMADRRSSNHKRAVRHGFGDALVNFRAREQFRSADGGTRLAECRLIRGNKPQTLKAKVTHGSGRCPDVEWIARGHQDDMQTVELSRGGQGSLF